LLLYEIDILDDIILIDINGVLLVVEREDKTHLGDVIAHRLLGV
jgi:hypothetical protein